MTKIEKLNSDLTLYRKSGNTELVTLIGVIKGELSRLNKKEFVDEDIIKVCKKMSENLITIDNYSFTELNYLKSFLPLLLSYDETKIIVDELINIYGKNQSMIMRDINLKYKGQIDNKLVVQLLKEI